MFEYDARSPLENVEMKNTASASRSRIYDDSSCAINYGTKDAWVEWLV